VGSKKQSDLKVTSEPAGTRLVKLTIEVPEDRARKAMQRSAKQIAREVNIPGFRKGKAPYQVVLQRFGEETILREAAESLVEKVYMEALEQAEIDALAPGSLDDLSLSPLRFVFTIPLVPIVELSDYHSLRVKPSRVRVMKDEVNEVLEQLREEHVVLEPAGERGAKPGDMLTIAVEGQTEDGSIFLQDEKAEVVFDLEKDYPAPGFYAALEGMVVDEERTFRLDMPDGKPSEEGEFKVRLLELFDRILPGVDDDLARTVGNYDNLKALEKDVREKVREQKRKQADDEYAREVVEKVVEQSKVEYPLDLLEDEIDDLVERFGSRIEREVRMSLPDYLKVVGKSEDDLREEFRPQAEERLRRSLVLAEIVQKEEIQVSEEEIEQRIEELVQMWGDQADRAREQFQQGEVSRAVVNDMLVDKVIDHLAAIARGETEVKEEVEEA
jgi:trigger factor